MHGSISQDFICLMDVLDTRKSRDFIHRLKRLTTLCDIKFTDSTTGK